MTCAKCGGSVAGYIDASNTRPLCKCKPNTETTINLIRSLETENNRLKELLRQARIQSNSYAELLVREGHDGVTWFITDFK